MAKLQRIPGDESADGLYRITGSLEGVSPPAGRAIQELEVRRYSDGDLDALRALTGLERLVFERPKAALDLRRLPPLPGVSLELVDARAIDLTALDGRTDLRGLALIDCEAAAMPSRLRLTSLRELYINEGDHPSGLIERLIAAIDWPSHTGLLSLGLVRFTGRPVELDFGFLRHLSALEGIDLTDDLRHAGDAPSPLEPPFEGLSTRLRWARITADRPDAVKIALVQYLAAAGNTSAEIEVHAHGFDDVGEADQDDCDDRDDRESWLIGPSVPDGFSVYSSFADAFEDQGEDFQNEYEAVEEAKKRLRRVDRELLRRLEFDQESDGTGVYAERREDLEAMLRILGVASQS